ncbi:MAG: glycosyltransferase [Bacteroidales bacterium]|nr:glycosyltransferase [Bacteroidales bacterium]
MLVGYEANNAMRSAGPLGDYSRNLISRIANMHVKDFRALLFSTRIKDDYRTYFSGDSNVSTYVPTGTSKLLPEAWIRYRLNPWLKSEKVKIFHGLNEELPYHIGREVKTVITCYGIKEHHRTSLMDILLWRSRMRYAFSAADAVVAVSEQVKQELLDFGVNEKKIVVISGGTDNPYEMNDEVAVRYFELYQTLLKSSASLT